MYIADSSYLTSYRSNDVYAFPTNYAPNIWIIYVTYMCIKEKWILVCVFMNSAVVAQFW